MPENTEQKSEVSEIDVSGFEQLQNVVAPTISEPDPDPKTDPRFQFVQAVKQLQPKYAYTSDQWILNELRENRTFRDSIADGVIKNRLENDNEFRVQWTSEEDDAEDFRQEYRKGLKQQILESTTRAAVKGETAKETIIGHHFNLSKKAPKYDIANPLSVVSSNPGEFADWLDESDVKNDNVNESVVKSLYDSDDDFRRKVVQVQVRNFEKALSNKANQGVFDPSWGPGAASEYAKAYAIFNRFGSEALTDYTNILQHYVPGEVQDNRVISAFRRFRESPQYKGIDIFKYATDFLGGRKILDVEPDEDIAPYAGMIQEAADKHDVDPALLAGLVTQESIVAGKITGVDPAFITSSAGARGLAQLMPDTARGHGLIVNGEVDERTDPIKSINAGARELSQLLTKYEGDEKLALAAYNAGQGTVDKARARAKEEGDSANWQKYMREFQSESNFEQTSNYVPKVQEFKNGYSTTAVDQLEFKTREPVTPRERDWNRLTELTYYTPQNDRAQNNRQKLSNFIEANYQLQTDGEAPVMISEILMGDESTLQNDQPIDLVKAFEDIKGEYENAGVEHFPEYKEFVYDIVQQSLRGGEGNYTFDDIVGTLAANAIDIEENDAGEVSYILDYSELDGPGKQHLRMLVDALEIHTMGDNVMTKTGNKVVVEPHKQARRDRAMSQRWLFNSEARPIIDEGRTIVGFEEHVPNNFTNTAAGVVTGATNILPEAWGGIVGGWGGKIAESLGAGENIVEFFDNQRHKTRDYYSGTLAEFTDPVWEPGGMPFSATDLGVAGGTLLGYLGGINFLGKGAILGAGKLAGLAKGGAHGTTSMFSSISALRKAQNFREYFSLARGSMSRAARDFRATHNAVSKKLPYGTWPKFVTGSAAIETFTDPNYSLATLVNSAMPNSVNQLAANGDWNLDRTYRTSGHMARWAMDFAAGEMLGLLFDGLIGVSKLANDHTFRALRGKPKLGLEYDPKSGKYKPEGESKYYTESENPLTGARKYLFPEIQRFVYNIRNNADNIPVGDIRKAAGDYATIRGVGPQHVTDAEMTQADITAKFVADSNDFMHTMREDIQGIIRDASDTYGGRAKLSEDDILKLTDEVYDEFMDGVARQTYSFIGDDRGWNIDTFARQLEDHPGDLADITPIEFAGETTLNRTQAQIAARRNPNAHVVPVGDGTYKVYEADPALWRFDIAKRLRQYSQQPDNFSGNVNRHLDRFGLDVSKDADVDDATKVIDTLENVQGVGFRVGDREGVISGFTNRGWQVRWDDGTEKLYGSIRGLDEVPETPPEIKMRKADTADSSQRNIAGYDEEGKPIYEDVGLRGSQQETEDVLPTLDVRTTSQRIDDEFGINRGPMSEGARATRQQELDELFPDAGTQINRLKTQLKEAMAEGRHDEADDIIREISTLRRTETGQNDEAIPLPGVVKLEEIVKQDKAAYDAARAYSEPDDIERIRGFHEERLTNSLRSKDEENILTDIQMLRGMGMSSDEMDELINENVVANESLRSYYRNYNRSLDFGEGVTDDLIAARVDARRAQLIEDEAWNKLPEKVQQQMIDQADLLANTKGTDEPQRLIDSGDAEVTAPRSWETSNERVRDVRPPEEGMSPKEYATQLAEDLGTGTVRDIAKLQKTRSGGSEKVPIRTMTSEDIVGPNGEIKPIKNSKGLVVRVDPVDGGLPYYAIGRKNNIKGFPTRFVPDQNGTIIYNQEWAFINPNVTQRADGQLKRFNPVELPNGEVVYRQHEYGKFVLNVQNPIRVGKGEYLGQTLKGTDGSNMVIPGKRTDQILTPDAVFRKQVDAIEIIDPA